MPALKGIARGGGGATCEVGGEGSDAATASPARGRQDEEKDVGETRRRDEGGWVEGGSGAVRGG